MRALAAPAASRHGRSACSFGGSSTRCISISRVKVTNSGIVKAVLKAPLGLPSESPGHAPKQRCAVASGARGQCLLMDRGHVASVLSEDGLVCLLMSIFLLTFSSSPGHMQCPVPPLGLYEYYQAQA
jgi:hypothetical protein